MKFSTALALAAALHAVALVVLWRTWPPAAPPGEVVPLELREVEPPAPPPPPVETPPAPAAGGAGAAKRRTTRMTIALAPEPAGDVPVAPSPVAETLNAGAGGGIGGSGGTGGGGTGGGGDGAGASQRTGGTAVAAPPTIDFGPLRAQAMERIRQQRRYPELARRRRIEGTVTIGFRVAADGGVTGVRVKRGVDELLDEAALDAVRAAAPLPAALSRDGELEVLLQFYLRP